MTNEPASALPGAAFWWRATLLVLARPSLWWTALQPGACGWPGPGGGAGRRSCPCPTPTTSASGSRPSTGPTAAPTPTTSSRTSSGAGAERAAPGERAGARYDCRAVGRRQPSTATRRPRREVPTLGKSPAAQRQLRAALRRADAPGRRARAEGEGRDRRAQRRRVLHSERAELPVPSVIRLVHFVRVPYRNRVPLSRRAVFARDGHRCQYCSRAAENIDHVVPRSRGGPHAWDNVVASCRACNSRKEDRLLSEAGLRLRHPPREPTGQPLDRGQRRLHRPRLGALPPRVASSLPGRVRLASPNRH